MLLEQAANWLGWPEPGLVLDPSGEGAAACVTLAKQKIGESLRRRFPGLVVETGILTPDPMGAATAAPLAVICQFPRGASDDTLREAHRLAWNFSRTALLVTLEPHRLIAWSCFQDPRQDDESIRVCEVADTNRTTPPAPAEQHRIRELLHWVSLVTGHIQKQMPERFPMQGRADALLLKNLRHVRQELIADGLGRDFCHDLLARVIFTQFLFHRADSNGKPFFSNTVLANLSESVWAQEHAELSSILRDKEDTYALFRWMDNRFNGDLFPGEADQSAAEREAAWQAEKDAVDPDHLGLLADLVSGSIDTTDRQLLLWPSYSFDTIPLEFISSVYEEFLNEDRETNKAYYTPPQLVDYVLDAVLPWNGGEWDLKVLDPACGSGIFLVKAFQRLIHRWRRHHDREPLVRDLKPLLANNFFGVDINPDAVRVACFSLYLAMADAIDPRHYVTRDKVFPRLRGTRVFRGDFFNETIDGIRTKADDGAYDVVVGNAPWGEGSIKSTSDIESHAMPARGGRKAKLVERSNAEQWAKANEWPVVNHDIGPLFIAKGLRLVSNAGRVAMVQPAPPWLYHRSNPALDLRRTLFESYTIDEVTNLSALRREMFSDVIGPSCVIVAGRSKALPKRDLYYFTPKPLRTNDGSSDFHIEPQDVKRLSHHDAAQDPIVWSVLALGGQRDLHLIRRLAGHTTLEELKATGMISSRMGVIPGDRKKELPDLKGKRYFEASQFPSDAFLELNADQVPTWDDPRVHSLHGIGSYDEFKNPQLLIKHSFVSKLGRFRAALVTSSDAEWGVICKETYLSVRDASPDAQHIRSACLTYNSFLATYFLFLTSSRLGHYITEVPTKELVKLPLADVSNHLSQIESFDDVDDVVAKAFSLTKADSAIIDDFLKISLPDAIRKSPGPARAATRRRCVDASDETELAQFSNTVIRVLTATFGKHRSVSATIYQEPADADLLPIRILTIHLDSEDHSGICIEPIEADGLLDMLSAFHREVLSKKARSATGNGLGFQRVAFFFHANEVVRGQVQNLTIIKPDEYRYWTRSQAMRDADDLATAIINSARGAGGKE